MNKTAAGLAVPFVGALLSVGFASSASADYGDNGVPPTSVSPPSVTSVSTPAQPSAPTSSAALPNTGGPNELLLAGALGLIAVGGTSVAVSRRRRMTT